jgi:hypothetical protein
MKETRMDKKLKETGFKKRIFTALAVLGITFVIAAAVAYVEAGSGYKVVGWNNLGMHCMDADFSAFSILPPYNTILAQVIDANGNLVKDTTGLTVTYEGIADPDGSLNTTSQGKTNFWQFVQNLFGVSLPADAGLAGSDMPGPSNTPKAMTFDAATSSFSATGIPITPYDDAGHKNYYPLMRVKVKDASNQTLAFTDVVLPVSDEMDCSLCHASGTSAAAQPASGWVYDSDPQRDYRLNVLKRHDDLNLGKSLYKSALSSRGFNPGGLYPTVVTDNKAILCATCHLSEALAGSGYDGIPPLTQSVHALHGNVIDPTNGLTLDAVSNRSACYRCHPGSETKCLRGAMGNAVASDGTMAIQCQDCHGLMSDVGSSSRAGWLNEPSCEQCHTGTAAHNNGQIRYKSVFAAPGQPRVAVDRTFATDQNAPAPGLSLYRFSYGHGGLACESCHGSTHAEFPSSHRNDNLQNLALQGHAGTISECTACHASDPQTTNGGPHGMHPVGQAWVNGHHGDAESSSATCQDCHGTDYRGTVLSRSFANRTLSTSFGSKNFWKGFTIGCYTCHKGPNEGDANPNKAPSAQNRSASTIKGQSVGIALSASDPDGNPISLRIVNQPANGTAGLQGTNATYFPYSSFTGTDTFTYAASDGSTESNLAVVTVTVSGGGGCNLSCSAAVPASAGSGENVSFTGSAAAQGCTGTATFDWNFGDGQTSTGQSPTHSYPAEGNYSWSFKASQDGQTCSKSGTINISSNPVPPPVIGSISKRTDPFRLVIKGSNFQSSILVYIGEDTTPWQDTRRKDSQTIRLGAGALLKSRFPKGTAVSIRLVNPDGGSATGSFTR